MSTDQVVDAPPVRWPRGPGGLIEVLRVAIPLMISTGCLSLVLFADRTLLLRYDGAAMSAAMAAGNFFWSTICLPLGIASMTGAFVAQYVGVGHQERVGRLLWQAVFLSILTLPVWLVVGMFAKNLFFWSGQPENLLELEATYLRVLMFGATASILDAALSGFFSGTHRTLTVMWINVAAAILNLLLDLPLIFGWGLIPAMGIAGAATASVICFWFKVVVYGVLLARRSIRQDYGITREICWDGLLMRRLLFFGFPAGLQYLMEAGAFTVIVLQIGQLGNAALQATTMAINFNMIAFVPMAGISIAASVLVGHHLTRTGATAARRAAFTALGLGLVYSALWGSLYLLAPEWLLSLYEVAVTPGGDAAMAASVQEAHAEELQSIALAKTLLRFVAAYVLLDSTQMILAGVLRGAGDTWYVLGATTTASVVALVLGVIFEPSDGSLLHWWYVITGWIWFLALLMASRFIRGAWLEKRLVEPDFIQTYAATAMTVKAAGGAPPSGRTFDRHDPHE